MRTVLVTGGLGFIGRAVTARLLDEGARVHVVDRAPEPRQQAARAALLRHPGAERLRVTRADLGGEDLDAVLDGTDVVVHLAGRPGVQTSWGTGFDDHVRENIRLTQRLLEAALRHPLRRVVVASSSSVVGEASDGPVDEDVLPAPQSPYGVSKAAVEQLAGAYALRGVPTTSLRFFTVYGRHQRPDMAVARMVAALGDGPAFPLRGSGRQQRDWTHVDDVAAGVLAATRTDLAPGTVLNLGSGRPVGLDEVLRLLGDLAGRPVPVVRTPAVPADPARTWADTSRAERLLGVRATTSLVEGLADQLVAAGVAVRSRSAAA